MTDDQAKAAFAANVQRELNVRGKNVRWLMQQIDEYPNRIYPAVKGKAMPGAGLLTRVANAFGVTVDDLLKPSEEISKNLDKSCQMIA